MPGLTTVMMWLRVDEEFRKQYAIARQDQADYLAEECLEIADAATPETANAARLAVDTRKWFIGKTCSAKYGDKGGEVHVNTTVNTVLIADRSRLSALQDLNRKLMEENKR